MAELLELTLVQSYYNQQIINRFNYIASGTPASVSYSFALTFAFGAVSVANVYTTGTVVQTLSAFQNDQIDFQACTVINPYSDTDFYSTGFFPPLSGQNTGEANSPAMAIGYRTTRVRRDIRRGQKRFAGVSETVAGAGGVIDTAGAALNALRVAMAQTLSYDDEGNTLTFQPAIVKKQKYFVDDDPNRVAYRYIPEANGGKDAQLADCATGFAWEILPNVRTQRSRQYGVGI